MITVRDALVSCITRWLPVLDEPELRAVEGFVLELVIAARENAIVLSARVPEITATPAGGMRADAFLDDSSVVDDPDATTPRQRFDVSDAGSES